MTAGAARPRDRARRGEGERLRDEILLAAERLLVRTGDEEAVSIRSVAEAVGVTPPSIYLHFADKDALMLAVCEHRFATFDAAIERASTDVADPVEGLRRRGRAYVRFGLENPESYRILFMTRHPREHDPGRMPGRAAFAHLVDAVQRCIDAGAFRPVDAFLVATVLWTGLHGVTSLLVSMPGFPWPEREALVDEVCGAQIRAFRPQPGEPAARGGGVTTTDR